MKLPVSTLVLAYRADDVRGQAMDIPARDRDEVWNDSVRPCLHRNLFTVHLHSLSLIPHSAGEFLVGSRGCLLTVSDSTFPRNLG
jgi:hypothetical protein